MSTLNQRSVLGRSGDALDQIHLSGIAARGFHGVLASEREAGQDFSADVTLYLDTRPAARGDDLTETVNYAVVAQDVADILSGAPVNLIETVAEQIAAAVLARPAVVAVDVAVHKPQAPIPVPFADVVVAIHRDRTTVAVASPVEGAVADLSGLEADTARTEVVEDEAVVVAAETPDALTAPEAPEAPAAEETVEDVEPAEPVVEPAEPVVETPQVRREPFPTAVLPVVISRPAEPEDELATSGAPLDGPLDGPLDVPPMTPLVTHSDVLAAPLAAPATTVPMSAAAFASDPTPANAPAQWDEPAAALPPVPFPGSDSTEPGETSVEPAPEPAPEPAETVEPEAEIAEPTTSTPPLGIDQTVVLAPLDEDVLAEQARMSEQARRPEVFGMATLSTGWVPPLTTDSSEVPSVTAPEDFLTAEVVGLDDVRADDAHEGTHSGDSQPADAATEPSAPDDAYAADAGSDDAEPVDDALEAPEAAASEATAPVEVQYPADAETFEGVAPEEAATEEADPEETAADQDSPIAEPVLDTDAEGTPTTAEIDEWVDDEPAAEDQPAAEEFSDDLNATTVLPRIVDRMDTAAAEPVEVVIALGANLGDAQDTLRRAVAELDALTALTITAVGPLARTAPVGGPDQPDYLNTIVLATTTMSPRELLHACQSIEAEHGRQRLEHWGPRTLDIDLITYGALVHSTDDLDIPHPRANERAFVLAPWAHVSPDAVLPGLGGGPVGALAATAPDRDGIRWLALDWLAEPEHSHHASDGQRRTASFAEADGEPGAVPQAPPL